jgi:hypothetical protein
VKVKVKVRGGVGEVQVTFNQKQIDEYYLSVVMEKYFGTCVRDCHELGMSNRWPLAFAQPLLMDFSSISGTW